MVSLGSSPFVSVVKHASALQLDGERASHPLKAGQTIAAYGKFDDSTDTDLGFFVVLRCSSKHHVYELSPIGSVDPYWGEHLKGKPSITAKVMSRAGEKVSETTELLTRWRVLAEPHVQPPAASLEPLGKQGAEGALKAWSFLSDYVVTEKEAR